MGARVAALGTRMGSIFVLEHGVTWRSAVILEDASHPQRLQSVDRSCTIVSLSSVLRKVSVASFTDLRLHGQIGGWRIIGTIASEIASD